MQIIPLGEYQKDDAQKILRNYLHAKSYIKTNSDMILKPRNENVSVYIKIKKWRGKDNEC